MAPKSVFQAQMSEATPSALVILPERHVVLVAPEIHWNTGNIGRTCLAANASLHLIKPLGFSLEDRAVKRAGLDYWKQVNLRVWESFDEFMHHMQADEGVRLQDCFWSSVRKRGACPNRSGNVSSRPFIIFPSPRRRAR